MDLLKTPHQKLMEEVGASPLPSPGMMKTPKQMLFEESGMLPKFATGGQSKMTPQQMMASLILNGYTPPKFQYADGGQVDPNQIANEALQHFLQWLTSQGTDNNG
jgi:hypothetical protein